MNWGGLMNYVEKPTGCISINQFVSFCISRYLPIVDEDIDVIKMLGMNPKRQLLALENIISNALREYERYCPLLIMSRSGTSSNEYTDNFDDYLAGKIKESEITLIPSVVARVTSPFGKVTSPYWQYSRPMLQSTYYVGRVKYFCQYPCRFYASPDGYLSDNSIIYGLYKGQHSRPDKFQTFFDYEFIGTLERNSKIIEFPSSSFPALNYERLLEKISELREEMIRDSLNIVITTGTRNL